MLERRGLPGALAGCALLASFCSGSLLSWETTEEEDRWWQEAEAEAEVKLPSWPFPILGQPNRSRHIGGRSSRNTGEMLVICGMLLAQGRDW